MLPLYAARCSLITQQALTQLPSFTHRTDWMTSEPAALKRDYALLVRAGSTVLDKLRVQGLAGRIAPRLALPPDVRTADTNRLIYAELAHRWLSTLSQTDLQQEFVRATLAVVPGHLYDVVKESEDLLLEGGSLPQLIMETLQNQLWGGNHSVSIVRIHINMTTANQVDDHLGEVGSALRLKTLEWLQRQFGVGDVFAGPVGTTFLIKVTDFNEARGILRRYSDEVGRMIMDEILGKEKKRSGEFLKKLERFRPQQTAFGMTLSVSDLEPSRISASPRRRGKTNRRFKEAVIGKIQQFLRDIATHTSFIEKNRPKDDPSNSLYTEIHLPQNGKHPNHKTLEALMRSASGYVATGVYGLEARPGEMSEIVQHPRMRRLTGHLNRDRALQGGGILQRFASVVGALLSTKVKNQERAFQRFKELVSLNPSDSPILGGLGITLHGNLGDMIEVGLAARRYASYPRLLKPMETRRSTRGALENANFFAEEMAHRGYRYVAASENDGAKARHETHPPQDHVDRDFQRVREIWFETARDLGMVDETGNPKVIIAPFQGDQILVGFDPTGSGQRKIDPEAYLKEVQRRVREAFSHQLFQREHKLKKVVRNKDGNEVEEIERIPIWVVRTKRGGVAYVASFKQPPHSEPLTDTQTITTTYTSLFQPLQTAGQREGLMYLFAEMGRYIETNLKVSQPGTLRVGGGGPEVSFPLKKEGFGFMPRHLAPTDWLPGF